MLARRTAPHSMKSKNVSRREVATGNCIPRLRGGAKVKIQNSQPQIRINHEAPAPAAWRVQLGVLAEITANLIIDVVTVLSMWV